MERPAQGRAASVPRHVVVGARRRFSAGRLRAVVGSFAICWVCWVCWCGSAAWAQVDRDLDLAADPDWQIQVEARFESAWGELDDAAQAAAESLADRLGATADSSDPSVPAATRRAPVDRLGLFGDLPGQGDFAIGPRTTLLVLDPDGEAAAWSGAGLLHEPSGWDLPREGRAVRRGVTATTLLSVRPVGDGRRPWRVVAGRSLAVDPFPFDPDLAPGVRWSVAEGADLASRDLVRIGGSEGAPALFVDPKTVRPRAERSVPRGLLGVLGALLLLAALLTFRRGLLAERRFDRPEAAFGLLELALGIALGIGGVFSLGAAADVSGAGRIALSAALVLGGLRALRPDWAPPGRWAAATLTATGFVAYAALVWWLQSRWILPDLAEPWPATPERVAWWLATASSVLVLCLFSAGVSALFGRALEQARDQTLDLDAAATDDAPREVSDRVAWLAAIAALSAAAVLDWYLPAAALGTLAAAGVGLWWHDRGSALEGRRTTVAGLALLAVLLAGVGWQAAHRQVFRVQSAELLPQLRPPDTDEINDLLEELHGHFDGLDIGEVLPPPAAAEADLQDLAFALWRGSPLPRRDGLSAVEVRPIEGGRSSFAFGLGMGDRGPSAQTTRWPIPQADAWRDALSAGEGTLRRDDAPWGLVRFWFQPRPGFRLEADETEELEANLVRGRPRHGATDGLPSSLRYALYDFDGKSLTSPWNEAPPLSKDLVERFHESDDQISTWLETPDGLSRAWLRSGPDGIETLSLPRLGIAGGQERVGTQALASFVLLLVLAAGALASAVPRSALRTWIDDTVRSYSKRLILVYTVLLLLPLVALNLVLLRGFSQRMEAEQLENAEAAVASARSFVVDYLLGLEPGFLFETEIDRELLEWISDLVGHQVNVYWGSRLWASSQQELFTSGLLPRRIPAEIYTRLTLLGYDTGFRTQTTGDVNYLEVYAPLDVPGIASSQQGLFLSVPLLEREEEVARDLFDMRRRALLITAALFVLLVAVGGRLARRFTRPIVELIDGTRRIARGAPLMPLQPKERELETLAEAIGVMARQVDESRRKLIQEKQFVERVVAHIDAAVVSVDRLGRILVQNRVAEELLGLDPAADSEEQSGGPRRLQSLDAALERRPELAPVRDFVARSRRSGAPAEQAVKIRPADDAVDIFEWSLTWIPLPGEEDPVELLVVDDATEVLRGQRLEAWVEMARIIAHEIKNPLTPIRLSTEHLQQVWRSKPERFGEVLDRCAGNILSNVEELRQIASEFSIYSRIPDAALEVGDLSAAVSELVKSYRHAVERGVEVVFLGRGSGGSEPSAAVLAPFDRRLLLRAVRNLLENAVRAATPNQAPDHAQKQAPDAGSNARGLVEVTVRQVDGEAQIVVADDGPGVDPQKLERIFEPYFSTHETGTGLGLAITRRIAEQHAGRVDAHNLPGGGLSVVITIPLQAPRHSAPPPTEIETIDRSTGDDHATVPEASPQDT